MLEIKSQSLLLQVFIHTWWGVRQSISFRCRNPFYYRSSFIRGAGGGIAGKNHVAIPSITGLHSYGDTRNKCWGVFGSQSLLLQVFIHTLQGNARWGTRCDVAIPSITGLHSYRDKTLYRVRIEGVAIPSITGLHSYIPVRYYDAQDSSVAIPSITGLHSYVFTAAIATIAFGRNPFYYRSSFIRM